MPVDAEHNEYSRNINRWNKARDCTAGSDAVKARGAEYLPMLGGQNSTEYSGYKTRALYFNAMGRTVNGLVGAAMRLEPTITFPPQYENLKDSITLGGDSVQELSRNVLTEQTTVGRLGLLVEMSAGGGTPYIAQYAAENIKNWRTTIVDSKRVVDRVVLKESYEAPTKDEFETELKTRHRVLEIVDGKYQQRVFNEGDTGGEIVIPLRNGKRLDYIPFQFINAINLSPSVSKAPLQDLVDVNLSHYRTSADLEHGAHFTALPTAWVAGFSEEAELKIGSQTAWVTSDVNAKAGFLEYSGQGLGALSNLKKDKEQMMAVLGARMLEESKRSVEAADTLRMRKSGEEGVLSVLVATAEEGITNVVKWLLEWAGATTTQIKQLELSLNRDFVSAKLTAEEITSLMSAWQQGGISQATFLYNLKQGEVLPPDRTIEDEVDLIDTTSDNDLPTVTPDKRRFNVVKDNGGNVTGVEEQ